jgi:5-methylcytosine-specific restriction endonuclease McrA
MSPRNISAALRQRVAEAARFRCGYCLTAQRIIGPLLKIDHFIPESRGGSSDEENLWLACPMCNSHKADRQEALDPESRAMVPLFNPGAARGTGLRSTARKSCKISRPVLYIVLVLRIASLP